MSDTANTITQDEYDRLLKEYLIHQQPINHDANREEIERWLSNLILGFQKKLEQDGITVRAGFHVDSNGQRVDED